MRTRGFGIVVAATVSCALTACSGSRGPDYVLNCMFETDVPGTYSYPAGVAVPTVEPASGGTAEGAAILNACIAQTAALDAAAGSSQRRATVETESVSGGDFAVSTYGSTASAGVAAGPGGLPLPTGYPLRPGDRHLWTQLTLAEQQRAILFLQDGSTIASSLQGDR